MLERNKLMSDIHKLLQRFISLFMLILLVICTVLSGSFLTVHATEETPRLSDEEYVTAADWPEAPDIGAEAAVLIEADSGTVLYAKNADSKRYPASITKILTALITIENSSLSDTLVFKDEALDPLPDGYVSIEPSPGEQMSVEDCLYGLLLYSANDAANALAVHDSGTIAAFAEKMNERAVQAGAKHTHFSNPSGLAEEDHYTTAYDMAMIMRACIQSDEFLKIAGSLSYTIPATNTHAARYVEMRHEMLKQNTANYYEYCRAGKTGFTTPSGCTLVTYAEKDGLKLICCVMQCARGVQYQSTRALFDYGFENFHLVSDTEAESDQYCVNTGNFALDQIQRSNAFFLEKVDSSAVILPSGLLLDDLEASVNLLNPQEESDECFAQVVYEYEGMKLGSTRLRMTPVQTLDGSTNTVNWDESNAKDRWIAYGCLAGILLVLFVAAILAISSLRKYRKEKIQENREFMMIENFGQKVEDAPDANVLDEKRTIEESEFVKDKDVSMLKVDFVHAKEVFEHYLDGYDREDERIKLKIIHTYCVVDCCEEIAVRMGLSQEDRNLAMLIGLLHDIGRFEQVKRYQSFEPATMDHALEGVRILFEEGMIRQFLETDQYDDIIQTAIAKHSDFELKGIEDERTLLHAKLIRDADKLDNCRVKLEDSIEVLLGKSAEEAGKESISDVVFKAACEKHSVFSPDRRTAMDYWVSYIVYIYDINFQETLQIIAEKNYMPDIIHRIPCSNPDTIEKIQRIESDVMAYLAERTKDGKVTKQE